MATIILGHIGSDAGYWYIGPDGKLHHVGGWQVEEMNDLKNAINALQDAVQIREQGVAEAITRAVVPFVERALTKNLKGEAAEKGIIIVGGATREAATMV
jgi:hypothetical protein